MIEAQTMEAVHRRRRSYTGKERAQYVAALEKLKAEFPGHSMKDLVSKVGTTAQLRLNATQMMRWSAATAPSKRSPKVNTEFEEAVLGELVFTSPT